MRQHHAIAVGNLAPDNRNKPGILGVHFRDELLRGWRIVRILTEKRTVNVIAETHAHQRSDVRGNGADVRFLRTDGKSQMAELVCDGEAGKNSKRGGGRY